jgi:type II secretory pathway component GspD/PulD (secretin)
VKKGDKTKIPLLGDIPVINFFFKSKEATKENTSLVFIVTPKSYNPTNRNAVGSANSKIRSKISLDCDHDWIDEDNPGQAHEPNMKRTVRGMQAKQAPYYPKADELVPNESEPSSQTKPRFSRPGRR